MNVMVLGGGGREHAICRGLKRSPEVTKLYCSPGNPGIAQIAECVALPAGDIQAVADFAAEHQIDLVVVGPELPLCQGVADAVRAAGIPVFGPSKDAARLEGSKDFSKKFMVKYGIPTDADLVFDVRFLPNPYYIDTLREKTGNEAEVQDYVMQNDKGRIFLDKLKDMMEFLIPNYILEGKNQLVIAIGCTGGKHRSVTLANALYQILDKEENYGVRIEHRDIGKDNITKRK